MRAPTFIRSFGRAVLPVLVVLLLPFHAVAQTPVRVQLTSSSPVQERPRGDSVVLGQLAEGVVVAFRQQVGRFVEVEPLPGDPPSTVPGGRGWVAAIHLTFLDPRPGSVPIRRGDFMVRAVGQWGETQFTAGNSFEALSGSPRTRSWGGGGQLVFPGGVFLQGTVDRISATTTRVILSNQQLFRTSLIDDVRLTRVQATVGYREAGARRLIGFVGAGAGWQRLTEESTALAGTTRSTRPSVHLLGGAEYRLLSLLWLAGEVEWTSVPNGLPSGGIGGMFEETDFGGTTVRVKVLVGR